MAKQAINIGTVANDSTGDTLRSSFSKCNDNFDELYTAVGTIPTDLSSLTDSTNLLFSGSYNDLTDAPTLFDGNYSSLSGAPTLFDGNYSSLSGAPSIPSNTSDLTNDSGFVANSDATLTLAVSTTAPASPVVGMFAVADGNTVGWDPKGTNSGVAYPVFYDGSSWTALF